MARACHEFYRGIVGSVLSSATVSGRGTTLPPVPRLDDDETRSLMIENLSKLSYCQLPGGERFLCDTCAKHNPKKKKR